jgi:hypothetical protein
LKMPWPVIPCRNYVAYNLARASGQYATRYGTAEGCKLTAAQRVKSFALPQYACAVSTGLLPRACYRLAVAVIRAFNMPLSHCAVFLSMFPRLMSKFVHATCNAPAAPLPSCSNKVHNPRCLLCPVNRTVYCEVFLVDDGRPLSIDHYYGIFIAAEKVKRVSIVVHGNGGGML